MKSNIFGRFKAFIFTAFMLLGVSFLLICRINAYADDTSSSSTSSTSTTTITYASPVKVTGVRQAYWLRNKLIVRVVWDKQNVAGYEYVFMDQNKKELATAFTTRLYYERYNISNKKYYYIKVRAVSYVDGSVVYGEYSDTAILFAPPLVKSYNYGNDFRINISNKKLTIKWNKPAYAEGYRIYVSKKRDSGYKLVKTIKKKSTTKATIKKFGTKKYKKKGTYYIYIQGIKTYQGNTYTSGITYVYQYKNGTVTQIYYHGTY